MKGDYRAQRHLAARSKQASDQTNRVNTAKAALASAEKNSTEKTAAAMKAAQALAAAQKTFTEKSEAQKKAKDEKALKEAEAAKQAAEKADADAKLAAKQAADAIAPAKSAVQAAEAELHKATALVEVAKKAAADAEKPIRAVAFSPDNLVLATGGDDHIVHSWQADDGRALEVFEGHAGAIHALAFAGAGNLVSASGDKSVIGWNLVPDWQLERTIGSSDDPTKLVDRVLALDFSPDGKWIATGSGEPSRGGELKIWNVADGTLVREIAAAHSDAVFGVAFSPDGKGIASASADKFVKVFDASTGKPSKSFEGHTHHVLGVSWKFDGKLLASCGADNVIKLWDYNTGEQQTTIGGFGKQVTSVRFIGESINTVSTSGDKTVRLHRTDNSQNYLNLGGAVDFMYSAAATPDGQLIAAGGHDSVLRVWNATNGQVIRTFEPPKSTAPQPPAVSQAK
jgi:WD40 repeat protein